MVNRKYLNQAIAIIAFAGASFAATIYTEDFENSLGTEWSTYRSNPSYGCNEITNYSANSGNYSWRMDASWEYNLNELVLHIDATGYKDFYLNFSTIEYNDETKIMSSSFTGHENSDGIAVSVDGTNWTRLWQYPSSANNLTWSRYSSICISSAISIVKDVYIKFQQYGHYPIASDGILWDDIEICATSFNAISGYVLVPSGSGISNVLVELTGDTTGQYITADDGYYNFHVSTGNYSYEITLSKSGWSFSPSSRVYNTFPETRNNQNFAGICDNLVTGTNYFRPVNNLFDPSKGERCTIHYNITSGGKVRIQLYTITGALVQTLVNGFISSGAHYVEWNGRNSNNQVVSSGIYLALIDGPGIRKTKRICVIK